MVVVHILSEKNLDKLIAFEKRARTSEPDVFTHEFDSEKFAKETLAAMQSPSFASTRCLICEDANGHVIGRIDFSIVSSFAFGGSIRAYVDWIYVLKECRNEGIAKLLFKRMEGHLAELGVNDYFLIAAENKEAQTFYHCMKGSHIQKQDVLTKKLC